MRNALKSARRPRPSGWQRIALALAGAGAAALGALLSAASLLPPSLTIPVACTGLMLAAAAIGLIAALSPRNLGTRVVLWDMAGLMGLIGFGAMFFGEHDLSVALIERER